MSDEKLPDEEYLKLVRNAKSELDVLRKYSTRRPAKQKDQEPFTSNTTIAESKPAPDMQIPEEPAAGGSVKQATHPFKVSPNGDDTVTVAAGNVIDFRTTNDGLFSGNPVRGNVNVYDGAEVTITASGTLFLVITYDNSNLIAEDSTFLVGSYLLAVFNMVAALDPVLSGSELSIPIAEIDLTDGVASVTQQILTHNPTLQLGYSVGLTP